MYVCVCLIPQIGTILSIQVNSQTTVDQYHQVRRVGLSHNLHKSKI